MTCVHAEQVGGNWIELPAGEYDFTGSGRKCETHCQLEAHVHFSKLVRVVHCVLSVAEPLVLHLIEAALALEVFLVALPIKKLCLSLLQVSHVAEGEWARMAPFRILSLDIECAGRKASQNRALAATFVHILGQHVMSQLPGSLLCLTVSGTGTLQTALHALFSQGHFPEAEKDPVIQIASMVTVQGAPNGPLIKNIMTLDTCDSIVGAEASPVPRVLSFLLHGGHLRPSDEGCTRLSSLCHR